MLNRNRHGPSLSTAHSERLIERFSHPCKKRWGILPESRSVSKQLEGNLPASLSPCLKSSAGIHTLLYTYSAVYWWSLLCNVEWLWLKSEMESDFLHETDISITGGHEHCTASCCRWNRGSITDWQREDGIRKGEKGKDRQAGDELLKGNN